MIPFDILGAIFGFISGGWPFEPVLVMGALLVFGIGWLLGKLTTRLGFFRTTIAILVGLYFYATFAQLEFLGVRFLVFGFLLAHLRTILSIAAWAQDLGDWWFALRYRRTFEDIRAQEREAEDKARQTRRAYHSSGGDTGQQAQWRAEAQARRGQKTPRPKSQARSSKKPQPEPDYERAALPTELQGHLQTLGLDPFGSYSLAEIRTAYRRMAKRTHPDLGGSVQHFTAIQSSFEWLVKRG